MEFFSILNLQVVTVVLGMNSTTALHFNEGISNYDLDHSHYLKVNFRRGRRTLVLSRTPYCHSNFKTRCIPKGKKILGLKSHLRVYMAGGKIYRFNIEVRKGKRKSSDIVVRDGKTTGKARKMPLIKNKSFEVYRGESFLYLKNLSSKPLFVNEKVIKKTGFTSLWSPILINGAKVWF